MKLKMEVIQGRTQNGKSSHSVASTAPKQRQPQQKNLSVGALLVKMGSKKRGVYVEKRASSKHLHTEDNKRQPRTKAQPKRRSDPNTLLTSTPDETAIAAYTRLLGTADPNVRFRRRKPIDKPVMLKQNSKTFNVTVVKQEKLEKHKKIEEKNKPKKSYRSNVLKQIHEKDSEKITTFKPKTDIIQTPSTSSKITKGSRELSTHWSSIFPKERPKDSKNINLLQKYICNYEQTENADINQTNNPEHENEPTTTTDVKNEPIYDFFIDLLESVYDEDLIEKNNDSRKSSKVQFEIDDGVAQKLVYHEENANQYFIRENSYESYTQTRNHNNYHNRAPLVRPPLRRRRQPIIKPPIQKPAKKAEPAKKPKKLNLLSLLKKELSMDFEDEPETLHDALFNIARTKNKRRQIYFEATGESSDDDGICRFKSRKLISPNRKLAKSKNSKLKPYTPYTNDLNPYSINTRGTSFKGSFPSISNGYESRHSLQVEGFDYEEEPQDLDSDYSDREVRERVAYVPIDQFRATVTHYWKKLYTCLKPSEESAKMISMSLD